VFNFSPKATQEELQGHLGPLGKYAGLVTRMSPALLSLSRLLNRLIIIGAGSKYAFSYIRMRSVSSE
jgi:hypothetical protein